MSKKAFTLAEVLITLGIIGIVAALTIPTLMQKTQKQQTVVALKKAYSTLQQAVKLSEIDNGSVDDWEFDVSKLNAQGFYETYLKPYLSVSKEYFNVSRPENVSYRQLSGEDNSAWSYYYSSTPKIILNDGTIIAISNLGTNYKLIHVDINGFKKPNQRGKDSFSFVIQPNYGVTPYGFGNTYPGEGFGTTYDRATLISNSPLGCNKASSGAWCSALILSDGWEMKDDYPW